MAGSGIYLEIDVSDAARMIKALRAVHTESEMRLLLRRVFVRTGKTVKRILKEELPKEYVVTPGWVGSQVGAPRMGGGLGAIGCTIPITGKRGSIGGRYSASGGAHGWNAVRRGRYRINASIVRDGDSTLPSVMSHQSGYPPFRNLSFSSVAFTRTGEKTKNGKDAIARVVGLAVPQMPLNRSKEDVQDEIMDTMMKRLEAEHAYIISKCR